MLVSMDRAVLIQFKDYFGLKFPTFLFKLNVDFIIKAELKNFFLKKKVGWRLLRKTGQYTINCCP